MSSLAKSNTGQRVTTTSRSADERVPSTDSSGDDASRPGDASNGDDPSKPGDANNDSHANGDASRPAQPESERLSRTTDRLLEQPGPTAPSPAQARRQREPREVLASGFSSVILFLPILPMRRFNREYLFVGQSSVSARGLTCAAAEVLEPAIQQWFDAAFGSPLELAHNFSKA